jgi:hypothetical protein
MVKNFTSLLAIILAFYSFNTYAQSQQFGLVHSSVLNSPIGSISLKSYGFYSPDSVYVGAIYTNKSFLIQPLTTAQKIYSLWKNEDSISQTVTVYCFESSHLTELSKWISENHPEANFTHRKSFNALTLKTTNETILEIANLNYVKRIIYQSPSVQTFNFLERGNHRVNSFAPTFPLNDTNALTGKNIIIGEWDGGNIGNHIDLNNRVKIIKAPNYSGHATHVAGTMSGAGNLNPLYRGMAPESFVFSWDFMGDIPVEMDTNKSKYNYVLTQNSYGYWTSQCTSFANYDGTSTEMDLLSNKHPDLLHVYAAANSRSMNCIAGGYGTITSGFQSAKNTLSVAAVTAQDAEASFSSAGPTRDGRFKPEIAASGVNVISTIATNGYGSSSGTSMATPGATGTLALLYQKFNSIHGYTPINYLAKNIIANGADDVGNLGPDFKHGFGRINGQNSIEIIDSNSWKIDSIGNNQFTDDTIYLSPQLHQLKVMLTWNDPEVNPSSNPILVNDLDLIVIDSAGNSILPWWCNPASPANLAIRKRDSLNNIEQVTILNPSSGRYIIRVFGKKIPNGLHPFAVSYLKEKKGISVVYPNGNETMEAPSSAAKSQLIRWDAKGVTGTFTIQFSRDSGANYTNIASGIANNVRSFAWQNLPDTVSTSKALIRIFAGSNGSTDESNHTFDITRNVTGGITFKTCDSQVYISWRKNPQTAFYRIHQLIDGQMKMIGTTADTNFLVTQLKNYTQNWFALSRRHLNGAESQRTIAFSVTPDSLTKPPKILLQPLDSMVCYTQLYHIKSKAKGSAPLQAVWQYHTINNPNWTNFGVNTDSLVLNSYFNTPLVFVRRMYTNQCLAPVYTRTARFDIDTPIQVKLVNRDTTVCLYSNVKDSLIVKSQTKPLIIWFKDSLNVTDTLYKGYANTYSSIISSPRFVWAQVQNLCGTVNTKDLSKNALLDGRNQYQLFPKPVINSPDTLSACIGETITIKPTLSGGRPGFQQCIIQTKDSVYFKNEISLKINENQIVKVFYFDNCYPDTSFKTIYIQNKAPLSLNKESDTTVCYLESAQIKLNVKGGNGTYFYQWKDTNWSTPLRTFNNLKTTQTWSVIITDLCTEKSIFDTTQIVVLSPLSGLIIPNKDTLCYGNQLELNFSPNGGNSKNYQIQWNPNGLSGFSPNKTAQKSETIIATLSDGCSPSFTDSVSIFVYNPLSVQINKTDTWCYQKPITLNAVSNGGKPRQSSVKWLNFNATGSSYSFLPAQSQAIIVELSDACSQPNAFDTLFLNVYEPLSLITIPDTQVCFGQSLQLTSKAEGGKTNTYRYFVDQFPQKEWFIDSFKTQSYRYKVIDGCGDSIVKLMTAFVTPALDITPKFTSKCSYNPLSVNFNANTSKQVNFLWDNGNTGSIQVFTNNKTQTYRVLLDDGCSDTTWKTVQVYVSDFSQNNLSFTRLFRKEVEVNYQDVSPFTSRIEWRVNSELSAQNELKKYNYEQYGQYTVCRILEDNIGCTDTVCIDINNTDPAQFRNFNINLYPNPVSETLQFTSNQFTKNMRIEIIDAVGKTVLKDDKDYPGVTEFKLNISALANGTYHLRITLNGEVKTYPFVKIN